MTTLGMTAAMTIVAMTMEETMTVALMKAIRRVRYTGNNRLHDFSWRQSDCRGYWTAYRAADDRRDVEGFHESGPTWAGQHHPYLHLYIWCRSSAGRPGGSF